MKQKTDLQERLTPGVLVIGTPGSGKTSLAMTFPNPYFANCANKIGNAQRVWPDCDFRYDDVLVDDEGREVPQTRQWTRLCKVVDGAIADDWVQTIVLDDLTAIVPMLVAHILDQPQANKPLMVGGVQCMDQSHWRPFKHILTNFIAAIRSTTKILVVPCHTEIEIDEIQKKQVVRPNIPGQLKNTVAGLFSDFWECRADTRKNPPIYVVDTLPNYRLTLIRSFDVPDVFEPKPGMFQSIAKTK